MQYELKITGAPTDDGAIDLDRLAELANLSKWSGHETVEQQLERQMQQKGNVNRLSTFIGVLSDDHQTLEADLLLLNGHRG